MFLFFLFLSFLFFSFFGCMVLFLNIIVSFSWERRAFIFFFFFLRAGSSRLSYRYILSQVQATHPSTNQWHLGQPKGKWGPTEVKAGGQRAGNTPDAGLVLFREGAEAGSREVSQSSAHSCDMHVANAESGCPPDTWSGPSRRLPGPPGPEQPRTGRRGLKRPLRVAETRRRVTGDPPRRATTSSLV